MRLYPVFGPPSADGKPGEADWCKFQNHFEHNQVSFKGTLEGLISALTALKEESHE